MLFSQQDIELQFPSSVFQLGRDIIGSEKITNFNIKRGGELITAKVSGADDEAYRVYIRTLKEGVHWSFQGECACNERSNCGHVVAVLLYAVNSDKLNSTSVIASSNQSPLIPALLQQNNAHTTQALLYILHVDCP